ncbi:DUF6074 family protein [Ensifer canadensis]
MTECKMIPFPLASRVGKVRRCAEVLQTANGQSNRDAYWRKTVGHFHEKLTELGLSDVEIRHQIAKFREAVQQEYLQRDYVVRMQGQAPEGGAA